MHDPVLQSGWESLAWGSLMVGILLLWVFKLDTLLSAPKNRMRNRQRFSGTCPAGQSGAGERIGCDPDGHPWPARRQVPVSGRG